MPEKFLSFLTCCRLDALRLSLPVHQQLRVDLVREEDLRHVPPQDESDQVPLLQHSGHSGQWTLSKMFDLSIMDIISRPGPVNVYPLSSTLHLNPHIWIETIELFTI